MKRIASSAVTVLLLTVACATVPPTRVSEVSSVAGRWVGFGGNNLSSGPVAGSGPVELTIRPDGTGEFFYPRVNAPAAMRVPITLRVNDGKLVYETSAWATTITLHERDGKRTLKGDAARKDGTGLGWFEVSQEK